MNGRSTDIAIAGGGLAGGLIALALRQARPDLAVTVVEGGETLGGNHRWSWFITDLDHAGTALLDHFEPARWNGYSVRFPAHSRELSTPYRSLNSAAFDRALRRLLPREAIRTSCPIAALDAAGIVLSGGERIAARTVIDARGIDAAPSLAGGWQVFMGRHLRTRVPHGLDRPIIMDAAVAQHGAYRFVYTLPLTPDELFVEDTYYANSPALDPAVLAPRIDRYCARNRWEGATVAEETGVLPVITGGNFAAFQAAHRTPGVAVAGARGGFAHPLTSYTLPFAAETALAIASSADLPGSVLADLLEGRARDHWQNTIFYRRLGRMLFGAGAADDRYKIFERFYRLPHPLIERFYAARSTRLDQARVLLGKPPVPVLGAMRALATAGPSLARAAA
ncbi:lycopene beta-cyclase CrtY [Parafrankia sp. BMG5.11]|uniref:lycopene beta-cyclase CrtY n=1 Tax=Parafrankia sp. BMG5.11 TaxID=222540 RepID=UPI00104002EA|nr:lycopene beta-cyclase CrtY [Parafrankia sp. BMG5.11]TCJ38950.1 lycopene cyclase [Parafrankia sp. BMG5.11]